MTHCTPAVLHFHPTLPVQLTCDAPHTSSDGGALLLRLMDERLGLTQKLAACIPDARDPARVVHSRLEQVRQRVYQMALGYEDCNDAHALRRAPPPRGAR
ncbi:transposase [Archangium violaceum]|uniref:transposase n=1 Tax=Archangium violaceum TaxID=83451 RepID=UPI001EEFDB81|nr:transposase [Archangium violaceum]